MTRGACFHVRVGRPSISIVSISNGPPGPVSSASISANRAWSAHRSLNGFDSIVSRTTSERAEKERITFDTHRPIDDAGREGRDPTDDLGDKDVRGEGRLTPPLLDHVHVRAVVTQRIRAVLAVVRLPRHDRVPTRVVRTHEFLVVGRTAVGPTREVHVLGKQPAEHLEVALVVVEPPPTHEILDVRRFDHLWSFRVSSLPMRVETMDRRPGARGADTQTSSAGEAVLSCW